jgi:WD40 repeat protein
MRRYAVLLAWILVFRSMYPCFGGGPKEPTVLRHSNSVICTVFTPDGKTLISSDNKSIRLWDVSSGKEKAALTKDDSGPKGVAVSPNGKLLASGNWDTTVRLWDIASGAEIATLRGHTGPVLRVAFSPDGSLLASGARDKKWEKAEVKLWDMRTRTELASLPGVADPVGSLAFSPDGKTVAVGDVSGSVFLWDVASKQVGKRLKGHTTGTLVIWSRDGRRLVSGGNDIRIWDPAKGELLLATQPVGDDADECFGLAMTKDGKLLASGSHRGNIRIWDIATGKAVLTLKQAPPKAKPTVKAIADLLKEIENDVYCVALSPDDTLLAAGVGPTVRVWDIKALMWMNTGTAEKPSK